MTSGSSALSPSSRRGSAAAAPRPRRRASAAASAAAAGLLGAGSSAAGALAPAAPRRRASSAGGLLGGGSRRGASSALARRALLGAAAPRRRSRRRRLVGSGRRLDALLGAAGVGVSSRRLVRGLVVDQVSDLHRFGLLGLVRMVGPGVDLQLAQLLAGEPVARKHPLDRQPDDLLGPALEHLLERALAQAARVAGVAVVLLLLALVAGDRDPLGVDDDHEVADVAVRRVLRLALAAQRVRDLGREPAERLAAGVDDHPVALAVRGCGHVGLHLQTGEGSGKAAIRGARADPPRARLYCRPLVVPAESLRPSEGNGGTTEGRPCLAGLGGESTAISGCSAALSARARQLTP